MVLLQTHCLPHVGALRSIIAFGNMNHFDLSPLTDVMMLRIATLLCNFRDPAGLYYTIKKLAIQRYFL